MGMEKSRFWSRIGDWFKHTTRPVLAVHSMGDRQLGLGVNNESRGNGTRTNSIEYTSETSLSPPPPRRSAESRGSDERYGKIEVLIDSLQNHFTVQDARSQLIAASLERLAGSLAHLPEISKAQLDILATIRDGVEAHAIRSKRLDESLAQLPLLADAQRETMASIGRQLDLSRQTNEQTSKAFDRFQEAVSGLGAATTASATALRQLHSDTSAKEERMIHVLEQQTKRFTFFACVAIASALLAAMMGLATAWVK